MRGNYQGKVSNRLTRGAPGRFRRRGRGLAIAAAAVVGGTLLGLTGGLAAPFVGAAVGSVGAAVGAGSAAAATSAFLTSAGGTALVAAASAGTGAGLGGYRMARRVRTNLTEFFFAPVKGTTQRNLSVVIGVSGLYPTDVTVTQVAAFWRTALEEVSTSECYALIFERAEMVEYGTQLSGMLQSEALNAAGRTAAKAALGSAIVAGFAWPALVVSALGYIDHPFSVLVTRAKAAGVEMARALREKAHGGRPVTLVGFGFGALAVFSCLDQLGEAPALEGVVQDALLVCGPLVASRASWARARSVVAGRLVNAFNPNDWVLQFFLRATLMHVSPATPETDSVVGGFARVDLLGVHDEEVDVTHFHVGSSPKSMLKLVRLVGS